MSQPPEQTPVIVGVGEVNDRPADPADGLDSLGLMAAALAEADRDAGGGWLADLDSLATVRQISWPQLGEGLVERLAEAIGAAPARRETTPLPHGESPTRLLNEAANRIATGETRIAAIVGGEAMRTATALARRAAAAGERPDILRAAPHRTTTAQRERHHLRAPVDLYPLYENATRAHWGQTLAEGQAESASIWAAMSEVAAANPNAWLREAVPAHEIATPSARNRPLSFPYTKLMVANSAVNQGAGLLVTSLAEARRRGVPDEALVFVGHGAGAHESKEVMARANYTHSPSLEASIRQTLAVNALDPGALDHVELYSCFPVVPKMARRVLDWPLDRPMTQFGGLTFGGAPVANVMSHAIAAMVHRLRGTGAVGLIYANGGIVTSNHAIVLSGAPLRSARFPRPFDAQAVADAARPDAPPPDEDYTGPATIETYTVHHEADGRVRFGVVVARTPAGARTLARIPADAADDLAALTDGRLEPVGLPGTIAARGDGWRDFALS